ncbi:MAG: fructose-1,6-bisphosphatase, partial [Firmicutes bacterium]|nr:fructose-1,6-bisphosphatase [Bacillota bacterium]
LEYSREYLNLLSEQFPTIKSASSEIIHLQSRQKLPKLTEHFMSDIHGEYESFLHIVKSASGVIKDKITSFYGYTLSENDRNVLATLIFYPEQKLDYIKRRGDDTDDWYKITIHRLIEICRCVGAKYTRAGIRGLLPQTFGEEIDELIHINLEHGSDREGYYNKSISSIVELGQANAFIIDISKLIQNLAIGKLHIIGDIFDRGPRADIIMDYLMEYHNVDIQWGNHDIQWMGAAAGSLACIANVLSISTRYMNFDCIEDGYGIIMRPLTVFALETYGDDPCECFMPKNVNQVSISQHDVKIWAKMIKAISIIQFKLEGQIIKRHPEFKMDNHLRLDKINFDDGTISFEGKTYKMKDMNFPTIDPSDPYKLTEEEEKLMQSLKTSFLHSEKLQRHVRFLYQAGSMYLCTNNNLLYHGCIPMNSDGTFKEVELCGEKVKGKSLLDMCETLARNAYYVRSGSEEREYGKDFTWFLWCGCYSPLYGKNKMTTFERYFIDDDEAKIEIKDEYYTLYENPRICDKILAEFGIDPKSYSHIINGHVPVKLKKGESPVKAKGKLIVIDGGMSKAYQPQTGIAGYTLLFNSHGLLLSAHERFESVESAIKNEKDMYSTLETIDFAPRRLLVEDTDSGKHMQTKIDALTALVEAYRKGTIKQKNGKIY